MAQEIPMSLLLSDRLLQILGAGADRRRFVAEDHRLSSITFFPNSNWVIALDQLKTMAMTEYWGANNSILSSYVENMFRVSLIKIMEEGSTRCINVSPDCGALCFNLNLCTPDYKTIYGMFQANLFPQHAASMPLVFKGWWSQPRAETFSLSRPGAPRILTFGPSGLPSPQVFFRSYHELFYNPDVPISINMEHIMQSDDDHARVQNALIDLGHANNERIMQSVLREAIDVMLMRIKMNSRTVMTQYFLTGKKLQLLLPLSLPDPQTGIYDTRADIVVVCSKSPLTLAEGQEPDEANPLHWAYVYHTVLTPAMAYNNARLLNRLESEWLVAR